MWRCPLKAPAEVGVAEGTEVPGGRISSVQRELVTLKKCAWKSKGTLQVTAAQMMCPQNEGWIPSRDGNITVQLKGTTSCHRAEQVFPAEK